MAKKAIWDEEGWAWGVNQIWFQLKDMNGSNWLNVGGDLVFWGHVVVEPDEAKNNTHGFGDPLVIGE